jgi:hypothetical protein
LHNETSDDFDGSPYDDEEVGPFNVMLEDNEAMDPYTYRSARVTGKTSGTIQRLNAVNAFRIILLTVLLFQILLPLDLRKPTMRI